MLQHTYRENHVDLFYICLRTWQCAVLNSNHMIHKTNEAVLWICRSTWGQDRKANLWFVLKCQSIRPAEASTIYLKMELAASNTNPTAKYMSVLIELRPLNPFLSMLNVHITAFISAVRSGETAGAIFPPCSKPTLRMRIPSTASFAENEPTQAFQTARVFHPVVVVLDLRSFITAVGSSPAHAQFIASPAGLVLGVSESGAG